VHHGALPQELNHSPAAPLRVGVMLDALVVPAWIAQILRQLLQADFVDLALVVRNAETPAPPRRLDRLRRPRRDRLAFNLYQRLDARVFRSTPDAFAPQDMSEELGAIPTISAVASRPRPFEHRFADHTVEDIRGARLDVAIRFGFNIIRGDILNVARYGVWSYHHGDHRAYRGSPAFFWEMYEGDPVSGTILQVLEDQLDGGRALYRSFAATDRLSLNRGRNRAYW
jgi:methionyl-tRNA formyltransferase